MRRIEKLVFIGAVVSAGSILSFIWLAKPATPEFQKIRNILPKGEPIATTTVSPLAESAEKYILVTRVIDGDTIEIETGQHVRYIGMDSPESVHPRKPIQCFGREASEYNRKLVAGKKVHLVKDVSETDRYGRLLRYVYLEDGTFINLQLVQEGYAKAVTWPPDVKYAKEFVAAERIAREAGRGLWNMCK